MTAMPMEPTLLRQFAAPPETLTERVASNIRGECARQNIRRVDLKRMLGWGEDRMRSRWEGRKFTICEVAACAELLEVSAADLFEKAEQAGS
jgi:hypothetical protein